MTTSVHHELLRRLPGVDEVLRRLEAVQLAVAEGRSLVAEAARAELQSLRDAILGGQVDAHGLAKAVDELPEKIRGRIQHELEPSLRRVINASGIIIHTNLGRAPLSRQALERVAEIAAGYNNLEYDLEDGRRGRRDDHAQRLLNRLFARHGLAMAQTIVVNNNAAAVLLALAALARGGEVIVSRGELVEIGGSFRIPEIMAQSGATLREVGSTNRTRIEDYEKAISGETRLLLRVHRSNFAMVGFTEQPTLAELVALGRKHGIPVMEDLGSGALVELREFGVEGEPSVYDSLQAGVDLVSYSGDKLLGGPQAGLLTGSATLVEKLRRHPLFRALRVDKMCYAALEATLGAYLREAVQELPVLGMMRLPAEEVLRRCERVAAGVSGADIRVVPVETMIGGGSAPGRSLSSFALSVVVSGMGANVLAKALRHQPTPIVARVEEDRVLLDLRTVAVEDDATLAEAIRNIVARAAS
jgi:L-seryl-tRNA(Ser) seleniumtransferase